MARAGYIFAPTHAAFMTLMRDAHAWVAQYRNPWGFVRMGKILEDLDSLAGNIAYEHW